MRPIVHLMTILTVLAATSIRGDAATLTVTNTGDASTASTCVAPIACSLRQAIARANSDAATDNIRFAIPGAGPHVISPASELPQISQPVQIDGYSQSGALQNTSTTGFNAVIKIQLSGANLPSGSNGLQLQESTGSIIAGLSITNFARGAGFGGQAISTNGAGPLSVTGCAIGITPNFTAAGNGIGFVASLNQTGAVRIGTLSASSPRAANLISQNTVNSIVLSPVSGTPTGVSFIGHNLINVSPDGNTFVAFNSIADSRGGITISANVIGGTLQLNAPGFIVTGNRIGGNLQPIAIGAGAGIGNIGGLGALANVISNSNGAAVASPSLIKHSAGTLDVDLALNRMFVTGCCLPVGIDLGAAGITENDPGDPDIGPNGLQNFPILISATRTSETGVVSVSGTLNSLPNRSFRLVFYANPAAVRAGEFLGDSTTDVTTDASGNAIFGPLQVNFGNGATAVNNVTATATLIDNVSNLPVATSEFAAAIPIQLISPPATFIVTSVDDPGNGVCDSACTLREAIVAANATGSPTSTDEIRFNIPGAGPHTIILGSALPNLTQSVTIDGYTQPGALVNADATGVGTNAVLKIEIRPVALNAFNFNAINGIGASSLTLRGLSFVGFFIVGAPSEIGFNSRIEGCWFGVRPDGSELFTSFPLLVRDGSTFGGASPAQRNIWNNATALDSRTSTVINDLFGVLPSGRAPGSASVSTGGAGGALRAQDSSVQGNVFSTGVGASAITLNLGANSAVENALGESFDGATVLGLGEGLRLVDAQSGVSGVLRIRGGSGPAIIVSGSGIHTINQNILGGSAKGVVVQTNGRASIRSSISGTTGLGIDLNNDGVTLNDPGDADTGANGLQNFPVLISAVRNGNTISVTGTLNSNASQNFRILICGIASEHSSLHGGCDEVLDDETIVTTDASGNTGFSVTVQNNPAHAFITATASRIVSASEEQTSEFALNIPISGFQENIFANGFEGL